LPGGATTSANVSFGAAFLPIVGAGSAAGAATRTGTTVQAFQGFTYNGAVAIDFALDGQLHFITSGDIPGPANNNEFAGDGTLNVNLELLRVSDITGLLGPASTGADIANSGIGFRNCPGGALAASNFSTNAAGTAAGEYNSTVSLNHTCAGGAIVLNPGDSFVVVVGMQAISNRGGLIDATHTFGVQFDDANTFIDGTHDVVAPGFLESSISQGAAVPEPASWTLVIAGLGLAGAGLRRRRARLA
jgi:hypothetical protein